MNQGPAGEATMRKGIGSDSGRIERAPLLARAMRRPELGALSGVILIYAVFFFMAGDSGMF
jgi:simple sugar transport system permease protein